MNSGPTTTQRLSGAGGTFGRRNQTARKLQLSDVDWYGPNPNHHPNMHAIVNDQDEEECTSAPFRQYPSSARRGRGRGKHRR